MALASGGYLWLNYVRFGDPLDTGYGGYAPGRVLADRVLAHGQFSPAYFFFNLAYLLTLMALVLIEPLNHILLLWQSWF